MDQSKPAAEPKSTTHSVRQTGMRCSINYEVHGLLHKIMQVDTFSSSVDQANDATTIRIFDKLNEVCPTIIIDVIMGIHKGK